MRKYAILGKNKELIYVENVLEWASWFEISEDRRIKIDEVGLLNISTVFLGLNHGGIFPGESDLWFETMIFEKKKTIVLGKDFGREQFQNYQERCETYAQALEMHDKALNYAKEITEKANKIWEDLKATSTKTDS